MRIRVPFRIFISATACFTLLTIGCGGGGDSTPAASTSGSTTAAPAAAQGPMGTASITGTVNFNGEAPVRAKLNMDRECAALHDEPVLSDVAVVNDGKLQWAFIYVKEGITGEYTPPSTAASFDQKGCHYTPHVMGVQTGQTVKILNSDPLLHNIHAMPETNRPFNFGMPKQGDERDRSFPSEEILVKVKCDVHPWMGAWIGVVDHPFFAVSAEDGTFSIENLPAGDYTIELVHEVFGKQTMQVTVADGQAATADFTVNAAA